MANVLTPILPQGIGQPYLSLFDAEGNPIKNTLTGIPLGAYISSWSFTYDEEKENQAKITIETGNPDTVDISELQENSTLYLQWGYIYPNGEFVSSPVRAIKVRDFNCTFDAEGTHISLVCIDGVSALRYFPPHNYSDLENYKLSSLLDQGYYNSIGIVIEEFTLYSNG